MAAFVTSIIDVGGGCIVWNLACFSLPQTRAFLLRCQDKIPVRQLAKFSHLGRTAQKWRKRKPSYYLLIYVSVVNVSALKRTASKMSVKVNLALYVKWCIDNEQKSELLLTMPNCMPLSSSSIVEDGFSRWSLKSSDSHTNNNFVDVGVNYGKFGLVAVVYGTGQAYCSVEVWYAISLNACTNALCNIHAITSAKSPPVTFHDRRLMFVSLCEHHK